ncbi:MAG TPA: sigma-70 family RNA polymerase sigma factor [Polyangia bacterium]
MEPRPDQLVRVFVARRPWDGDRDALGELLAGAVAAAARAWPTIPLDPLVFVETLAEKAGSDSDLLTELALLRAADLYLATAAVLDCPGAFEAFERAVLARVPTYLVRFGLTPPVVDEVQQALRVKLFVAEDPRQARIRQYSGRGALDSWVCAAAIRAAHDFLRRARDGGGGDDELDVLAASDDPELELMRQRHQADFRAALAETIGALQPRQRTLLRMHFLERLTTIELGRLYGVNQSTASRWLAEARQTVSTDVRARLRARLRVSETEMESLLGLLQSQLDVSFARLLRSNAG